MARAHLRRGEDLARRAPRAALSAAAFLAAAALLPGAAAAAPARWHFALPGEPPLRYSILFSRTEAGDETTLLLETAGTRLALASRQDPAGRDSTETVTDPATKESFARRLVLSGWEGIPGCAALTAPDACLVFTGARGNVTAGLAAFSGEGAPALRARVAALVSPALDARLAALGSVFPRIAEMMAFGDDFLRLVWPGRFARSSGVFPKGERRPGCDFDAAFGYPCSDAERRRERSFAK